MNPHPQRQNSAQQPDEYSGHLHHRPESKLTDKLLSLVPLSGLFLLTFAGYIKGAPLVQELLPFDMTLAGGIVVAIAVVVRAFSSSLPAPPGLGLVLTLWASFLVGVLFSEWNPYSNIKIYTIFTFSILSVVGALFLLQSPTARAVWLLLTVGMGLLSAILAVVSPDVVAAASGRLAVDGSNTIGSARATGAAVVTLMALALTGRKMRITRIAGAIALGLVMIDTGSRGPLLAAVLAIIVVGIASSTKGRVKRVIFSGLTLTALAVIAGRVGLLSERISSVNDFISSESRSVLWAETWPLMLSHPAGIGWGNLRYYLTSDALLSSGWFQYPHNILLEVTSESSWLAGILLLIVLIKALARQRVGANGNPVESAFLGLLIFYVTCALVSGDVNSNRGVWVTVGAALVAGSCTNLSFPTARK